MDGFGVYQDLRILSAILFMDDRIHDISYSANMLRFTCGSTSQTSRRAKWRTVLISGGSPDSTRGFRWTEGFDGLDGISAQS